MKFGGILASEFMPNPPMAPPSKASLLHNHCQHLVRGLWFIRAFLLHNTITSYSFWASRCGLASTMMAGSVKNVVICLLLIAAPVFGGITDITDCKYKADNGDVYDLSPLKSPWVLATPFVIIFGWLSTRL